MDDLPRPLSATATLSRDDPAPPPFRRRAWREILGNVWREIDRDHISVMAAGVAFYTFLSIFPAMSAVISIYGLIADPAVIEQQVGNLAGVLPPAALQLLSGQLQALIAAPHGKLGIGLIISLLITFWSAMSGVSTLMQALTVAYEEKEHRGVIAFYGQTALLTIAAGVFGLISLFLIAVVPAVLDALPFPSAWQNAIALTRWPILAGLVFVAFAVVYRYVPSHHLASWRSHTPGTIASALLWMLGSAGFSLYVTQFASYNKTYGSLGAVVVLLMWLYVSAYIVLAGAELNSEIRKVRHPTPSPASN